MNITPLGGANEVGASCILTEIEGRRILVDVGIRMNVKQDKQLPDLNRLDKLGMPDAFLLTHAHTDHTGALPELVRRWPSVKGYCTPATKAITRVLLNDSKNRLEREKQEGKESLFTHEEINAALQYLERMVEVPWWERVRICSGVTATWIPAGHILGAAMILIEGKRESILMTGDVSVTDQKTIPGMSMSGLPYQPDVMVMESTYGNRPHKDRTTQEKKLVRKVAEVIEAGGKVLIPTFAIGRSQEVILILKHAMQKGEIPEFPVWVDGMARKVNGIYSSFPDQLLLSLQRKAKRGEKLFYSDTVRKVSSKAQRNSILEDPPCCIVAPSGMLKGGWSSDYAKNLVKDRKNLIAIVGYQAKGNPGYTLEKEKKWKQDDGTAVLAECQVERYSLSAHADRDQLTGLVEKVQPRKLLLVHGDPDARKKLSQSIRKTYPAVDVGLPKNGSTYTVEKRTGIAEGRQLWHDRMVAELYASVLEKGLKGPFSIRELTEMWFGTEATTLTAVSFFLWCLSLDSQFFERRSGDWFYPRQPA